MEGISLTYMDHMGDDLRVYQAAKATMGTATEDHEVDPTRLINFLARERHVTPFRHPQVTFECEAPIFVARQLGKHSVGFSWNERSMRYRDSAIGMFRSETIRGRPDKLHDGSSDVVLDDLPINPVDPLSPTFRTVTDNYLKACVRQYDSFIKQGMAPEQARMYLPQAMLTRWVWTGSLWGWFEVYRQRSSKHAQVEVQAFAADLDTHMGNMFPIAWKALKNTITDNNYNE